MRWNRAIVLLAIVMSLLIAMFLGAYVIRKDMLEEQMTMAIADEDVEEVLRLVKCFPCPVEAMDGYGQTILCWAVNRGRKDIVKHLLARGADVNAVDRYGLTPLHSAALYGHRDIGELLIEAGGDVDANPVIGTPLHSAGSEPHTRGERIGKQEVAALLIAHGADVQAVDGAGRTPLHEAAEGGMTRVARMLIDKGACVDARMKSDATTLHVAALFAREQVAALLVANGADVNAKQYDGMTALQEVAGTDQGTAGRREGIAKALIANGADVNSKDIRGVTPLRMAETSGNKGMAELLRRHGAVRE